MKFLYFGGKNHLKKSRKTKKLYWWKQKTLNFILGGLIVTAMVSYVIHSNNLTTKGYEIRELEKKAAELKKITGQLESRSLELQSLSILSEKVKNLNMVEIDNAQYIIPQENPVVKR